MQEEIWKKPSNWRWIILILGWVNQILNLSENHLFSTTKPVEKWKSWNGVGPKHTKKNWMDDGQAILFGLI